MLSLIWLCIYLQLSLGFAHNLHGERQSYSVRLHEVPTVCNPTLLRPIEQVSTMCTYQIIFNFTSIIQHPSKFPAQGVETICKEEQRSRWREVAIGC